MGMWMSRLSSGWCCLPKGTAPKISTGSTGGLWSHILLHIGPEERKKNQRREKKIIKSHVVGMTMGGKVRK